MGVPRPVTVHHCELGQLYAPQTEYLTSYEFLWHFETVLEVSVWVSSDRPTHATLYHISKK